MVYKMIGAVIGGGGGCYTPKNSNKTKNFQPMLHFWGGGGYHCGREEGGREERKEGGREIGREERKEGGRQRDREGGRQRDREAER